MEKDQIVFLVVAVILSIIVFFTWINVFTKKGKKRTVWLIIALCITAASVVACFFTWKHGKKDVVEVSACKKSISKCDDIQTFCYNPSSSDDVQRCANYCKNLYYKDSNNRFNDDCLSYDCDLALSGINNIWSKNVNGEYIHSTIIESCYNECQQRTKDGIQSIYCSTFLCSKPNDYLPDESTDVTVMCNTFCENRKFDNVCFDRTCSSELNNAECSCYMFLQTGDEYEECINYCTSHKNEDICKTVRCIVDPKKGCDIDCSTPEECNVTTLPVQLINDVTGLMITYTITAIYLVDYMSSNLHEFKVFMEVRDDRVYFRNIYSQYLCSTAGLVLFFSSDIEPLSFTTVLSGQQNQFYFRCNTLFKTGGGTYSYYFLGLGKSSTACPCDDILTLVPTPLDMSVVLWFAIPV